MGTVVARIGRIEERQSAFDAKFDGFATRVPVIDGALIELSASLKCNTSVQELNNLMKFYAEGPLNGIMAYTSDPIVSSDIINNPHSVVFDALATKVLGNNMVQLILWYDNEFAYSRRVADLILLLGAQDKLL
ncbi:MAG: Glyceraldehyde-3-phosphate dehydrogenase [Bacteroidetes bacterium ADurb.Bin408]|nr:MAG: Glyceraldehyde-3-phosphate dehydrogenase [Bacteroidetes bacterium ADurb.Bin408]